MAPATVSDGSLPALLSSLTTTLESAYTAVPETIVPPEDGISLLDIKNELFLSYLHNLVFLILLKIRDKKHGATCDKSQTGLNEDVVKKLVELRAYLERGVRPLEGRLKYQIDKVVRAAENATKSQHVQKPPKSPKRVHNHAESDESEDDNESADDVSDAVSSASEETNELAYRPNPSAFARPTAATSSKTTETGALNGKYRPPRITATAMPEKRGREERSSRQAAHSAAVDEFINEELSTAPRVESVFGPSVASGGRRTISKRELADQAERTAYEESNFVRLPKLSKKERAKKGYDSKGGYGGEDWRDLNGGLDRIDKLTRGKGAKGDVLGRTRKRVATEDSPRGGDVEMGRRMEKRRKMSNKRR